MHSSDELPRLLDEAVKLEQYVTRLYQLFQKGCPEDASFWHELATEEEKHAALLQCLRESFVPVGLFPQSLVLASLREMENANLALEALVNKLAHIPLTRREALRTAMQLEAGAGEMHLQRFVDSEQGSSVDKVFRELYEADKNHAQRIEAYAQKIGVSLHESQ